jgi:hypothetical protein
MHESRSLIYYNRSIDKKGVEEKIRIPRRGCRCGRGRRQEDARSRGREKKKREEKGRRVEEK